MKRLVPLEPQAEKVCNEASSAGKNARQPSIQISGGN